MNFFLPDNIATTLDGRWIVPPADEIEDIAGVGIDTRESLERRIFFAIRGQQFDGHNFLMEAAAAGARFVIVDRQTSMILPHNVAVLQVDDTRKALGTLAAAYRHTLSRTVVVGVTGSAGKTTTRDLIHHILKSAISGTAAIRSYNNDIGVPLTILRARQDDHYLILEIGTNAPGEIAALTKIAQPDIAVVTSIGRAHLEGLGSVDGVRREKLSMMSHLSRGAIAIVPESEASHLRDRIPHKILTFGSDKNATFYISDRGRVLSKDDASEESYYFELNNSHRFQTMLPGKHNALNATAAIMVANQFGLPFAAIRRSLKSASLPVMRMSRKIIDDVTIYNDAYNANPESMQASIAAFFEMTRDVDTRRVLILGDMHELGLESEMLHQELGEFIAAQSHMASDDVLVTVGIDSKHIASATRATHYHVESLDDDSLARIGDIVLPGDHILLKGSRSNRLERFAAYLESTCSATVSSPA